MKHQEIQELDTNSSTDNDSDSDNSNIITQKIIMIHQMIIIM